MRRALRLLAILIGVVALSVAVYAFWPKPPLPVYRVAAAAPLRIDGATIVDTETGALLRGQSILIEQGRIVRIAAPDALAAPAGTRRIDATGQYVVPGFNNMHTHVLQMDNASEMMALMLAEGVTGFRQMAGSPEMVAQRRNGNLPLTENTPALLALPGSLLMPFNTMTVEQTAAEIARQKAEGVDFLKLGSTSPAMFYAALAEARRQGMPIVGHLPEGVDPARASQGGYHSIEHLGPGDTFWIGCSRDKTPLLVEAAEHPVMKAPPFKIPGFVMKAVEPIILAKMEKILINPAAFSAEEDVRRLQRSFDSYDDAQCRALAGLFARNRTWMVPTLVRLRTQEWQDDPAYERDASVAYMKPDDLKLWREVRDIYAKLPAASLATYRQAYARQLKLTKLLDEAGVPMLAGTDGGGKVPGQSLAQEFDELAKAGLSPLRILQMTTIDPARFLGRTATMGTVTAGRNADLVLLAGNPLEGIANFHRITGVVRAGHYRSTRDFDAIKARIAAGKGYFK